MEKGIWSMTCFSIRLLYLLLTILYTICGLENVPPQKLIQWRRKPNYIHQSGYNLHLISDKIVFLFFSINECFSISHDKCFL